MDAELTCMSMRAASQLDPRPIETIVGLNGYGQRGAARGS